MHSPANNPLLSAQNLSAVFSNGKGQLIALKDITFSVDEQEFVCVLGPSGSGKSTLLRILGGLLIPTNGQVILGGQSTPAARSAHFVCALCLAVPGEPTRVFTGKVHGHLVWPPRGAHGFGYDPVFQPDGHDITFGEMNPHDKHAMSHRAHAFAQLVEALSSPATPAQPE